MATDRSTSQSFYARVGKPTFDRFLGLILAVLTLPAVLLLLVLAWGAFGWPPLQRMGRIGRYGRRFNLYRINTRKDHQTDLRGRRLRLSSWLRRTSLDELPQVWNVVLGHMSLVGPRPLDPVVAEELNLRQRHLARPGLTGPWQIDARGDGRAVTDNLAIDQSYLQTMSFGRDMVLLARTLPALVRRREEV